MVKNNAGPVVHLHFINDKVKFQVKFALDSAVRKPYSNVKWVGPADLFLKLEVNKILWDFCSYIFRESV